MIEPPAFSFTSQASLPPAPSAEELARLEAEKQAAEQKKREEAARKAAEEKKRREALKKKQDEAKRLADLKKKQEEAKKAAAKATDFESEMQKALLDKATQREAEQKKTAPRRPR